MTGLVLQEDGRQTHGEESRLGLRFYTVRLPKGGGLRGRLAAERAARLLRRQGVRYCVFPEGFRETERFRRCGVLPVDPSPLWREKAAQWTLAERAARGLGGPVAVAAERVTPEVERAVERLSRRVGRVELTLCPGAEALQRKLLRGSGAPLRLIDMAQAARAETLLDFTAREGKRFPALRLGGEERAKPPRFVLAPERMGEVPQGVDTGAFFTALWRGGALAAEEIGVRSGGGGI
ncbi:MAG: hypothetical protein ACI3WR_07305 [Oscillospiraceae bacterium]